MYFCDTGLQTFLREKTLERNIQIFNGPLSVDGQFIVGKISSNEITSPNVFQEIISANEVTLAQNKSKIKQRFNMSKFVSHPNSHDSILLRQFLKRVKYHLHDAPCSFFLQWITWRVIA